jgi:hypothetical protein
MVPGWGKWYLSFNRGWVCYERFGLDWLGIDMGVGIDLFWDRLSGIVCRGRGGSIHRIECPPWVGSHGSHSLDAHPYSLRSSINQVLSKYCPSIARVLPN